MNTEPTSELERRASKHAALGEPARLRIIDLLMLGDLAPSEIRRVLNLPANLVTHHLNVLESVGMLSRSQSEADRRRTYVRLTGSALAGLVPNASEEASRVVFVCRANSARSQLAAALWRQHSRIPSASAGTNPSASIAAGAALVAKRRGLDLSNSTPRSLPDVLRADDFVVTVCDHSHERLKRHGLHWSIPDPVPAGTDEAFDATFIELERRITELAPRLTAR